MSEDLRDMIRSAGVHRVYKDFQSYVSLIARAAGNCKITATERTLGRLYQCERLVEAGLFSRDEDSTFVLTEKGNDIYLKLLSEKGIDASKTEAFKGLLEPWELYFLQK